MQEELTVRVEHPELPAIRWNEAEVQQNLTEMLAAYTGRVHIVVDLAVVLPLFQLLSKNCDLIAFLQHAVPLVNAVPEVNTHKEALPFAGFILCAAGFQVEFQHLLLPDIPEHRVFGDLTVQHDAVLGLDDHASSPWNGSSAFSSAEGASGAGIRVPAVLR